jgi:ADP-ribose pyrophosphatase YjhB (NUDIX family)
MAVIHHNQTILASQEHDPTKHEDFHRLLGGSVEFGETGETGEQALRREFREELGTELDAVRRIDVLENLFTYDGARATRSSCSTSPASATRPSTPATTSSSSTTVAPSAGSRSPLRAFTPRPTGPCRPGRESGRSMIEQL